MAHTGRARQKEEMIAALLSSGSILEASEKCKVPARTLHRYLAQPEFQAAYRQAKSKLLDGAILLLKTSSLEAVEGLKEIAKDVNATSSARVTAWRSILEFALRGDEQEQIKDRLNELENNLEREPVKEWE